MYCTEVEVSECVNPTVLPSPTSSSYSSFSLITSSQDFISLSITGTISTVSIATSMSSIISTSSSLSSISSSSSSITSSLTSYSSSSSSLFSSTTSEASPSPTSTPTSATPLSFLTPELTAVLCVVFFLILVVLILALSVCICCFLRRKPVAEVSITQAFDNPDYNGENIRINFLF